MRLPSPTLVVSFHDLAPHCRRAAEEFALRAGRLGVARISFLLVPRWHGVEPIGERPSFVSFVHELAAQGHEICLHGETHRDDAAPARGLVARVIARHYTAGEGEFYGLGGAAAAAKIDRGLAALRDLGLAPRGFVAPAWLLSPAARRVLVARGFAYTTTWGTLDLLPQDLRLPAPALVWSSRSPGRRALSRAVVRARFFACRRASLLRIAVHPGDLADPGIRRGLLGFLERAAAERRPRTYLEVVADLAGRPPASQTWQGDVTSLPAEPSDNCLSLSPVNG